jgi:hypothetical protein
MAGCAGWGWLACERSDSRGWKSILCFGVWFGWQYEWNVWLSSAGGELSLSAAGNSRGCPLFSQGGKSIG